MYMVPGDVSSFLGTHYIINLPRDQVNVSSFSQSRGEIRTAESNEKPGDGNIAGWIPNVTTQIASELLNVAPDLRRLVSGGVKVVVN
jgi:hypothetical protein